MQRSIRAASTPKLWAVGLIATALISIAFAGFWIGGDDRRAWDILQWIFMGGLTLGIMLEPFLGIVLTLASLPALEILPPVPYATSAVSLLGGLTLTSVFAQSLFHRHTTGIPFARGLLWGLAFIGWMFVTNTAAALLPGDDDRVWLFTFVQLLILAWLGGRLLDTPKKHYVLMAVYSLVAVISAIYAIQQGFVGETIKESIRSGGLAGGANAAARYYAVGVVFLYFLQKIAQQRILRLLSWLGIGILVYGTLVTVSRTGLLLLVAVVGMLMIQRWQGRGRAQGVIVFLIAIGVIWVFADNVLSIARSILPAVREGTDTVGVRYALWQAGLRMWQASPLWGVGIGQYPRYLPLFGGDLLSPRYLGLGAHNMYIQVLAETGAIGLLLFLGFLGTALYNLWHTATGKNDRAPLAQTWLVILLIMLLGGITKHDHYDKLVWMCAGIGISPLLNVTISMAKTNFRRKLA